MVDGTVTSVGSRSCLVHVEERGEVRCTLRGLLWQDEDGNREKRPVAVGDHVVLTLSGEEGVIESVAERTNRLARSQPGGGKRGGVQVIAANIDRLIVVAALDDPPFRPGLVDRFLVAAEAQEIHPVLVLNKVDLPGDRGVVQPYRDFDYDVLEASAVTGEGIGTLRDLMSQGINLLVGHSGVGKTSLLNAVSPGLKLSTGEVADYHGRGKHTTTRVVLVPLAGGGWVVDSPGIREFAVQGVGPAELARLYPGFAELPTQCRFGDCRHKQEPGCAVRKAVEDGTLPAERHERYLRLLTDVEAQADPFGS
ncbi:MAG: ribosome small subunit-dependent GTPase A [Planctomycetota bacterium]|jgi:ribosome biogenesis GTPase